MQASGQKVVSGETGYHGRGHHPQVLLTVYFNSERTLGEKSALGPMIERLETYGEKKRACNKCQGECEIDNPKFVAWQRHKADYDAGLLSLLLTEREQGQSFATLRPPPVAKVTCYRCKGAGEMYARKANPKEITAWPTGSSEDTTGNAAEPDYDALLTLAAASRVMMRLGRLHGHQLCKALEAYHGRAGDWCQAHLGNRVFAVAALDPVVIASLRSNPDTEAALKTLRGWASNPDRADAWALIEARAERLVALATRAWSEVCRAA